MAIRRFDAADLVEEEKALSPRHVIFGEFLAKAVAQRLYGPIYKGLRLENKFPILASGAKHLRIICWRPFSSCGACECDDGWTESLFIEGREVLLTGERRLTTRVVQTGKQHAEHVMSPPLRKAKIRNLMDGNVGIVALVKRS